MDHDTLRAKLTTLSDEELIAIVTTDNNTYDVERIEIAEEILKSRDYNIEYQDPEPVVETPEPPKRGKSSGAWKNLFVLAGLGFFRSCVKPEDKVTLVLSVITFVVALYYLFTEDW